MGPTAGPEGRESARAPPRPLQCGHGSIFADRGRKRQCGAPEASGGSLRMAPLARAAPNTATSMQDNRYAPPASPLAHLPEATDGRPRRKWHTNVLFALLALWSPVTLLSLIVLLARAPRGMLGFLDYYVFLSVPILIGVGAWLLFVQSRLRPWPFLVLPVMYFLGAIRLHPELSPSHRQFDASYLGQFPLAYTLCAGFFLACAVYGFALNQREAVAGR